MPAQPALHAVKSSKVMVLYQEFHRLYRPMLCRFFSFLKFFLFFKIIRPRNRPFGGWIGVVPMFVHGFGYLVDRPVFEPMFVHGNGLLVDRPVFEPMFVHGIGHLVDG